MKVERIPADRIAKGQVGFWTFERGFHRSVIMTEKGWALLRSVVGTGRYVHGPRVAIARKLERDGLLTLRDDDKNFRPHDGPTDGYRWWIDLSAYARKLVEAAP